VLVGMTQFAGAGVASTLLRLPRMRREQRAFELAMALATEPSLLLLDEPAAGLNDDERADLGALIRRVNASDVAVLLIEHDVASPALIAWHAPRHGGRPAHPRRRRALAPLGRG
jgi:ABC-type nitrate/sulfonate/bicarbonate transport system ATPase subunit